MNAHRYARFAGLPVTVIRSAACLSASALISAQSLAAPPASLDAKAAQAAVKKP